MGYLNKTGGQLQQTAVYTLKVDWKWR